MCDKKTKENEVVHNIWAFRIKITSKIWCEMGLVVASLDSSWSIYHVWKSSRDRDSLKWDLESFHDLLRQISDVTRMLELLPCPEHSMPKVEIRAESSSSENEAFISRDWK